MNLADPPMFSGRAAVTELRARARRLFENGASGEQVASALGEGTDRLVVALVELCLNGFDEATRERLRRQCAVVAVGGTGRGEVCPYSDVDLLFLYEGAERDDFLGLAAMIVRECWDAGIKLGHSVRTVRETLALARREPDVATALVEARPVWGSERLVDQLRDRFRRFVVLRNPRAFVENCINARIEERRQFGGTVRQLAPNVKCSPGGLRDVHLLRWIGFARYGTQNIDALRRVGGLLKPDADALRAANDFLLHVRHDLHFHAGREADVLTREDQLRITNDRRITGTDGQRPVERFMQRYFRHAGAIEDVVERFVALNRPRPTLTRLVDSLFSHRVDGVYRVGPQYVDVLPGRREEVCGDLERVMELYRLAAMSGVLPSPLVGETITRARLRPPERLSERVATTFLELLRCTSQLGPILRSMYATGVLDCVVPDVTRTRGLLQFNQYHSFTVDEHTLRVVEEATAFEEDEGSLGTCYANVRHKEILHLALLLHDLGKGFAEDHSDVGREIAERTAERLSLSDRDRDVLVFLVHQHLLMTHLAFRRDITDPAVVVEFAQQVGSANTLRMLYLLSAADLKGVGPDTWTSWKGDLLRELFEQSLQHLSGRRSHLDESNRLDWQRDRVVERLVEFGVTDLDSYRRQLANFPPHYLLSLEPTVIANDLRVVAELSPGEVVVHGVYEPNRDTVEYRVVARPQSAHGYFARLTGTLAAKGMDVLAASIATTTDRVVVDRFDVADSHHEGTVPPWRIDEVCEALRKSLEPEADVELLFRRHRRIGDKRAAEPLSNQRTRVTVDNDSSERCTVIDVFAHDRPGLLYVIGRALYDLGLSVEIAKISTHLDQVVDVFYVTDEQDRKVDDDVRLTSTRETLYAAIEEFERDGYRRFEP